MSHKNQPKTLQIGSNASPVHSKTQQQKPENMQELQNSIRPFAQSPSGLPFPHCPFWSNCSLFLTSNYKLSGETKRKFESVYTGGTMNTPESGKVFQYWHCCGSEDPFDPGCTAAPHASYDD
ncbi:hypothetical protein QQP08_012652 [Theobroma cacao]|nr:hypothetical protein QQP08_012652 [Theobroma cacao]